LICFGRVCAETTFATCLIDNTRYRASVPRLWGSNAPAMHHEPG
jgi:hypothetical protein